MFSVVLSGPLLGQTFAPAVGILDSHRRRLLHGCHERSELQYHGISSAMVSNLAMVLRNITSKKSLNDFKHAMGSTCMVFWVLLVSFTWLRRLILLKVPNGLPVTLQLLPRLANKSSGRCSSCLVFSITCTTKSATRHSRILPL